MDNEAFIFMVTSVNERSMLTGMYLNPKRQNETIETKRPKPPKRPKRNDQNETAKTKRPKRNGQNETTKTKRPKRNDRKFDYPIKIYI